MRNGVIFQLWVMSKAKQQVDQMRLLAEAELELRRRERIQGFIAKYENNREQFALDLINWRKIDDDMAPYQLKLLRTVDRQDRTALTGPRGLGKTFSASIIILHFAIMYELKCQMESGDWKIITTASVNRQLREYLWPEVHKMQKILLWR